MELALVAAACGIAAGLFASARRVTAVDRAARIIGIEPPSRATSSWRAWIDRLGRGRLARVLDPGERLRRSLELAGTPFSVETLLGIKVAAAAAACVTAAGAVAGITPLMLFVPPTLLAATRGPDIAMSRMGRRRQQRIEAHVPDLAELLVATTEAGLSPALAIRRATDAMDGPLRDELRASVDRFDLGVPWRTALEELVGRTESPSLKRLVTALERSQRVGTSLGLSLRAVAADLRAERRARAEEAARRAPVKMLFPLVFLILPAFLLLTVGPVLLATLRSLH